MIPVTIKTTTKRLIIHEAESTHKYHHKYPLKKLKQSTYETLGKLEENLTETSGYFTVLMLLINKGLSPLVRIPAVTRRSWRLPLQISLDYHTIPPTTQVRKEDV